MASVGFVSSENGIHLWAPMHTAPQRFTTQAAAEDAAKRFDLITFNPAQLGGYALAMKAANPNLKLYVYLNGTFLYKRLYGTVDSSINDVNPEPGPFDPAYHLGVDTEAGAEREIPVVGASEPTV